MNYAEVINDTVVRTNGSPVQGWEQCPDKVEAGWVRQNGQWVNPVAKASLTTVANLECHRRIKELTGDTGETWAAPQLNRLADYADKLTGLIELLIPHVKATATVEEDAAIDAQLATVNTARAAVWPQIKDLRTKCATLKAAIEAGTITTEDQIKDAANWQ